MKFYEDLLISNFFKHCVDAPDACRQFTDFLCMHPELTLENIVLLFLQAPDAPRYIAHKGIMKERDIPTDSPVSLLGITLEDRRLVYEHKVFYCVPVDEEREAVRIKREWRAIFNHMGISVVNGDVQEMEVDVARHRITLEKGMGEEKRNRKLIEFLCDFFFQELLKRGPVMEINKQTYVEHYRAVLQYMTGRYLGLKNSYIPKLWMQYEPEGGQYKKFRLLHMLWTELVQVIDGRHFTVFDSELFRLTNGKPYSKDFHPETALKAPYEAFLHRFVDREDERINYKLVHMFPPYRIQTKRKDATKNG